MTSLRSDFVSRPTGSDREDPVRSGREHWLLIGGHGQIGSAICRDLAGATYTCTGSSSGRRGIDLSDLAQLPACIEGLLEADRPSVVILLAAFSAADACEMDPERADLVNHRAAALIAARVARYGARFVFLSTEYVFDGKNGPYDESDPPRPLSVYGRSKLDGEIAVLSADPRALVVRTTTVFGPEKVGKNFAYQLADRLCKGESFCVANDQISTPTYNRDLARAIIEAVRAKIEAPIIHLAGHERMSRACLAQILAKASGLDRSLIVPLPTAELAQVAPRPLDAGLISRVARPATRSVTDAVADWLAHPVGRSWPCLDAGALQSGIAIANETQRTT
jgi:dTDP-4-dehydrorhamnose reductase